MKKETYYIFLRLYEGTDAAEDLQIAEVEGKPEARKMAQAIAKALGPADYTDVAGTFIETGESAGHESFKVVSPDAGEEEENGGLTWL